MSIQKGCVIVQICIALLNGMFTPETVWGLVIFGKKGCVIVQICIALLNGMFTPETVWGLVIFGKMKSRDG